MYYNNQYSMYRKLKESVPGAVYSSEGSSSAELDRRVREVTRQKEEEAARSEARDAIQLKKMA